MDAWCDDGGRCPPAWAKWTDGIYHYHRDLGKAGPAPTPSGCMSTLPTYSLIDNALHIEELGVLVVLLDAVDYGGPQRSSCGPVSRRVRLGWRSLVGIELSYVFGGSWGLFPQSIPR